MLFEIRPSRRGERFGDAGHAFRELRSPLRAMMEDEELVGRQRELSVGLPIVVRELDLAGTIQEFHDGANLPA